MPKKRRSEGKGKIIPTDMPDRYQAKCKICRTTIKAATKADLKLAMILHVGMTH